MILRIKKPFFALYVGRDRYLCLPASLSLYFGLRPNAPRHSEQARVTIEASWEWLPQFVRMPNYNPRNVLAYRSYLWTGRVTEIVGWHWEVYIRVHRWRFRGFHIGGGR